MIFIRLFVFTFIVSLVAVVPVALAQQPEKNSKPEKVITPESIPSLFFTYWQHQSIKDSKNIRGVVRPPTQAELEAIERGDDLKPDPSERYLSLSGIVFTNDDDWTIWFNGKRVTPDAVPAEVLDLKVYKNYIELKWFDDYTNQVFPIRLKAHERFNMDQRIFLPG